MQAEINGTELVITIPVTDAMVKAGAGLPSTPVSKCTISFSDATAIAMGRFIANHINLCDELLGAAIRNDMKEMRAVVARAQLKGEI